MKLYQLLRGHSKQRMHVIMIDELRKIENYKKALKGSDKGCGKTWHYDIQEAEPDAQVWRKHNNYGQWSNYNSPHPPLVKNGSRRGE